MSNHVVSCLGLVAALCLAAPLAHADAVPPVGSWVGQVSDGGTVTLNVQANGSCMYQPSGAAPTVGVCTWNPSSPVGGILTVNYRLVFPAQNYYSVVWTSGDTFVLSDPYFRAVMHRRG